IPNQSQHAQAGPQMPSLAADAPAGNTTATAAAVVPPAPTSFSTPSRQQPSPSSDSGFAVRASNDVEIGDSQPDDVSKAPQGRIIHVKDLSHIRSLVKADILSGSDTSTLNDAPLQQMKYD